MIKTDFDEWLETDEAFKALHKDQREAMNDAFLAGWSKGYITAQKEAKDAHAEGMRQERRMGAKL